MVRSPLPKVLFVTSELYPLVKTGGLGDVSAGLPAALRARGVDVRILIPGYSQVLDGVRAKRAIAWISPAVGSFPDARLLSGRAPDTDVPLLIVDCPALYLREGGPYQDRDGQDWPSNYMRFGLLCYLAAQLGTEQRPIAWRPDLVHCNDWQAGLAPTYLHFASQPKAASVQTIHNLGFQGIFPAHTLALLGLPAESFNMNGVEYYGSVSFLKAGLFYADRITTVSPTYAAEIQTEPLGMGLQGLLATRSPDLIGVLNGIDTAGWDPAHDTLIARQYSSISLPDKSANKLALQSRFGLRAGAEIPLLGSIGRLTAQKGIDLLLEIAPRLLYLPAQLVLLGTGDSEYERALQALAAEAPHSIAVTIGFDEELAHLITAGSDMFLMPSRFEPCGLNQMYSQRYGTPPVAHATGGLVDSITDCNAATLQAGTASGFLFTSAQAGAFYAAVVRAMVAFRDQSVWQQVQRNAMQRDFSWGSSAKAYLSVYQSLTGIPAGATSVG